MSTCWVAPLTPGPPWGCHRRVGTCHRTKDTNISKSITWSVFNPHSKTCSRHCLCRWIEWTGEYLQTFMSLQPGLRSRSIIDNTNSSFYILVKGNRLFSISLRVDTLLWMVQRQDGCLPVWWPILNCASCIHWLSGHSSMWGSPTISL